MNTVPKFVDYKNTQYLKTLINPHGRITSGKRNEVPAKHQRMVQNAVKRARFMGLMAYVIK